MTTFCLYEIAMLRNHHNLNIMLAPLTQGKHVFNQTDGFRKSAKLFSLVSTKITNSFGYLLGVAGSNPDK